MNSSIRFSLPQLSFTKPRGLAPKLFFSVYHGPNAVAFAQLSSRASNKFQNELNRADGLDRERKVPGVSYCLKQIEVKQSYRNQGIGSALLNEVIRFCEDERVSALYGEAKGDHQDLPRWYSDKGFQVDRVNNIQMCFT